MSHYEYTVLEIIEKYNEERGIGGPILDRIFYDKRLEEGIPVEDLYNIRLISISHKLQEMSLIEIKGSRHKITIKGKDALLKYRESQS